MNRQAQELDKDFLLQVANAFMALAGEPEEKAAAAGMTGAGLFGAGGIFSVSGLDANVISAHVRPTGIIAELDRFPSVLEQPFFPTITGFTGTTGSEPTNPCDDAPSGYMKGCNLTAQFGRIPRDTQTIDWDQTMRKLQAGVTTPLTLRGRLLGLQNLNPAGLSESDALNIVTMAEMVGAAVQVERLLNTHAWQGNPANNTAGGGYKEMPGLDRQIATGQVDANSNQACVALDSDVKDFNFNDVTGTTPSIVEYVSMMEYFLYFNGRRMGLDPVSKLVVMRPELWQVLTEIWPCQYNTAKCATSIVGAGSQVIIDGRENIAERDRMRASESIEINGRTYQVVQDDGIHEDTNITNANLNAGQYASSLYFVPLTITGNFPVTYLEYVDYRRGATDRALLRNTETFWTDDGIYSWAAEFQKWCYKLSLKIEPRIVLRTPHLAGKIQNIMYEPLQHLRSPDPDSPYHADGGVSIRPTPTVHHVW